MKNKKKNKAQGGQNIIYLIMIEAAHVGLHKNKGKKKNKKKNNFPISKMSKQTEENCLHAVKQEGYALKYVNPL